MRKRRARFGLARIAAALFSFGAIVVAASSGPERHLVVVVWDGMRPDFISEQNTPTLWKLAKSGVTFRNHHSVYPSATIVNGAAIATGVYPNRNGILANHDYRPEIDSKNSVDSENVDVVRKGDHLIGGRYLGVPTIPELIHQEGGKTAIAAAKTVGLLFDRHADARSGANIFAGESVSPDAIATIAKTLGVFPPATQPAERDAWTTTALVDFLWRDGVPAFSLLWLSEPDDTQHKTAPGARAAMAAMKSSDENLGRVLKTLDRPAFGKPPVRQATDIFVVSDHGFSTIARAIDVRKILRDAGFDAVTEYTSEPKTGQIMLVGNGGTVLFYVIGHDVAVTRRLVEVLQQTDFAGVIFTREPMGGTFTLDKAKIDSPLLDASPARTAPDVEMAFRWSEEKNQFGVPGLMDGDWQRAAGKGTHATLSKFDMHNLLIAAGPDFRNDKVDELPSGNVDLAPTILKILGIAPAIPMDGRVLSEAMVNGQSLKSETQTLDATKQFSRGTWRQELKISRVGPTLYFDEGNGAFQR